jgi:1,4-alpha-glucan branching enzyme
MVKTCCGSKAKVTATVTEFRFNSPKAKKVSVAGCFNNWDPKGLPAKKDTKGNWVVKTSLKPGKYEYKFFVDGCWMTDPKATAVFNSFGTQNSVIEVK